MSNSIQKDIGLLILRLFVGIRLLYGVADNIFHWGDMKKFEVFLQSFHFPLPLVSAIVSVYAQAIAGILFIIGWKTKLASVLMIINFAIAIIMVHRNDSFEAMTPALFILITSIALFFTGAGKYALDKR